MRKLLVISDCGTNVPLLTDVFSVTALEMNAPVSQRLAEIQEAEVIIGEPTLEELREAKHLRWLQMTWAGADRYLKGGFPENVKLTTASGAFGQTIAEHALALLLSLCRRLTAYHTWKDMGSEKQVFGSTALIFGCGDIGSQIAKHLKALGAHTIGVCQNPKCQRLVFQLREFDLMTGNIVIDRNKPKRIKHQSEWVEKLECQETTNPITTKIKHGNKSAMAFIFGKSKITPLGTLHTGIDFNGTKRKEFLTVN